MLSKKGDTKPTDPSLRASLNTEHPFPQPYQDLLKVEGLSMSFQIESDKFESSYASFLNRIREAIQATYTEQVAEGHTRASIAAELEVDRSVVSKRLSGAGNITLRTISDLYVAMGRIPLENFEPHVRFESSVTHAQGSFDVASLMLAASLRDGDYQTRLSNSTFSMSNPGDPTAYISTSNNLSPNARPFLDIAAVVKGLLSSSNQHNVANVVEDTELA